MLEKKYSRPGQSWIRFICLFGLVATCSCASDGETLVEAPQDAEDDVVSTTESEFVPEMSGIACAQDQRLGTFSLDLSEDYTSFRGAVSDGVSPNAIFEVVSTQGPCQLYQSRSLFCGSPCPGGQVCAGDDVCVEVPVKKSVGTVTVSGLEKALELSPNGITFDYSNTFTDPYPGFSDGAEIILRASGDELDGVNLRGEGVAKMESKMAAVVVKRDTEAQLSWEVPEEKSESVEVHVLLTVNAHGGTGGWLECTTTDLGAFSIPARIVTELIDLGLSGFPRATLTRRTVDRREVTRGCVEFFVASGLTIPVEVPGLLSCSDSDDCATGSSCSVELVCEEE